MGGVFSNHGVGITDLDGFHGLHGFFDAFSAKKQVGEVKNMGWILKLIKIEYRQGGCIKRVHD